jgi:hypothetical protein
MALIKKGATHMNIRCLLGIHYYSKWADIRSKDDPDWIHPYQVRICKKCNKRNVKSVY